MNQPKENIAFNFLILGKLIYKFFLQRSIHNAFLVRADLHRLAVVYVGGNTYFKVYFNKSEI